MNRNGHSMGPDGLSPMASEDIGEVDNVSARAFMGASFGSLALGETKPQRIGPRPFPPLTEMMVSTSWLGAKL